MNNSHADVSASMAAATNSAPAPRPFVKKHIAPTGSGLELLTATSIENDASEIPSAVLSSLKASIPQKFLQLEKQKCSKPIRVLRAAILHANGVAPRPFQLRSTPNLKLRSRAQLCQILARLIPASRFVHKTSSPVIHILLAAIQWFHSNQVLNSLHASQPSPRMCLPSGPTQFSEQHGNAIHEKPKSIAATAEDSVTAGEAANVTALATVPPIASGTERRQDFKTVSNIAVEDKVATPVKQANTSQEVSSKKQKRATAAPELDQNDSDHPSSSKRPQQRPAPTGTNPLRRDGAPLALKINGEVGLQDKGKARKRKRMVDPAEADDEEADTSPNSKRSKKGIKDKSTFAIIPTSISATSRAEPPATFVQTLPVVKSQQTRQPHGRSDTPEHHIHNSEFAGLGDDTSSSSSSSLSEDEYGSKAARQALRQKILERGRNPNPNFKIKKTSFMSDSSSSDSSSDLIVLPPVPSRTNLPGRRKAPAVLKAPAVPRVPAVVHVTAAVNAPATPVRTTNSVVLISDDSESDIEIKLEDLDPQVPDPLTIQKKKGENVYSGRAQANALVKKNEEIAILRGILSTLGFKQEDVDLVRSRMDTGNDSLKNAVRAVNAGKAREKKRRQT